MFMMDKNNLEYLLHVGEITIILLLAAFDKAAECTGLIEFKYYSVGALIALFMTSSVDIGLYFYRTKKRFKKLVNAYFGLKDDK